MCPKGQFRDKLAHLLLCVLVAALRVHNALSASTFIACKYISLSLLLTQHWVSSPFCWTGWVEGFCLDASGAGRCLVQTALLAIFILRCSVRWYHQPRLLYFCALVPFLIQHSIAELCERTKNIRRDESSLLHTCAIMFLECCCGWGSGRTFVPLPCALCKADWS